MTVPPFDPAKTVAPPDAAADIPTVNQRIRRVRSVRPASVPTRYRAIALHARGGVGEVYRAKDAELDREVALKQLQADGASDPTDQARFVCEARITGRLQHPGIVPVYGLVHDALGRPSYAMRFIEGESLAAALGRAYAPAPAGDPPPTLRQMLIRFIAVCNAVAYAHSKGVVHRDLKPANIMLGPFGETYVVDWGLAKETASGGGEAPGFGIRKEPGGSHPPLAEHATQLGEVVGTPAFMAPEQAAGQWDEVGPPADVYSLGATLYNLLTGSAPFAGTISDGVLDRVRSGRFVPPRDRRPDVPAALEAVCLRAMAHGPADRYPSALALAGEVEHWLADEPVDAFADRWPARLSRWGRRRRALVGSVAAAGFAVLVSLAIATVLLSDANRREQHQREVAVEQERIAQAERDEVARQRDRVNDRFLLARDAVGAILTNPGLKALRNIPQAEPARRQLLEVALKFHEEFILRAAGDPTVREEAALARFQAGDLDYELGRNEAAIKQYELAIALLNEIADIQSIQDHVREILARTYNNLSLVQVALGQHAAAERSLQMCLNLTGTLVEKDKRQPRTRADLARHYHNIARLQREQGRVDVAEKSLLTSLAYGDQLLAEEPARLEYLLDQSRHHRVYADLLKSANRLPEAEPHFRNALAFALLAAEQDAGLDNRRIVAAGQIELGGFLAMTGRSAEAESLIRAGTVEFRGIAREFPFVVEYLQDLAHALRVLGSLMAPKDARLLCLEAAEIDERAAAIDPKSIPAAVQAAGSVCNYGVMLEEAGDLPGAIAWYGRAVKMLEGAYQRDPKYAKAKQFLIFSSWNRANAHKKADRDRDALPDWERVADLDDGSIRAKAMHQMAWAGLRLGDPVIAAAAVEKGLALESDGAARHNFAFVLASAAKLAADRPAEADGYARRAVAILIDLRADPILRQADVQALLKTDETFAVLRDRADFQALLAELPKVEMPKK
jgi:serine/threonine protein kinase/tetratricopeptide (TPR) repeat protein